MESSAGARSARLTAQDPDGHTWSHQLGSKVLIGRGEHCDIRLDDDRVSTDHAEVTRHGGSYLLSDLDSSNGTVVNGRQVNGSQRLRNADVIQVGPCRLEAQIPPALPTSKDRSRSAELSDVEQELAVALAAPFRAANTFAARPPTHRELAERLHTSESTVKRRLASLAGKLRVPPDSPDRSRLVTDRVIALGLDREL